MNDFDMSFSPSPNPDKPGEVRVYVSFDVALPDLGTVLRGIFAALRGIGKRP